MRSSAARRGRISLSSSCPTARTLIAKDPERVLENASSLMLMGYLIRTQEERRKEPAFEQPLAYA